MVPMVGTLNSIYRGEESPPIQGVCARYHRCRPARARSIGYKITEVLPSLQNIFVEALGLLSEFFQANIGQFVTSRQFSNHPIAVSVWDINSSVWSL